VPVGPITAVCAITLAGSIIATNEPILKKALGENLIISVFSNIMQAYLPAKLTHKYKITYCR